MGAFHFHEYLCMYWTLSEYLIVDYYVPVIMGK